MAEKSAEAALDYLQNPVVVGSLATIAAASMMYVATRPTPQKCPVDPNHQSVELEVGCSFVKTYYQVINF